MLNLRVAHAYDRNRYHPPEVSGKIATAICEPVEKAFRDPHILEVGVGTGRIGMPVVARGFRFTGVDTDPEMMELFRAKYSGVSRKVKLLDADAQALPFPDAVFHGVVAVHVFHLVPDIAAAVDEALRVTRPGGYLFEGWDVAAPSSPELVIQDHWCQAVEQYGYFVTRGAHRAALDASAARLCECGLDFREATIARWEVRHTPLEVVEALSEGLFSFTRNVPTDVRFRAARDVKAWVSEVFPDLDTPIKTEWAFHMRTTRLPAHR